MAVTEKDVREALKTVKDPELGLDLVVLGLVYDVKIEEDDVQATISLTSPMCPVAARTRGPGGHRQRGGCGRREGGAHLRSPVDAGAHQPADSFVAGDLRPGRSPADGSHPFGNQLDFLQEVPEGVDDHDGPSSHGFAHGSG